MAEFVAGLVKVYKKILPTDDEENIRGLVLYLHKFMLDASKNKWPCMRFAHAYVMEELEQGQVSRTDWLAWNQLQKEGMDRFKI